MIDLVIANSSKSITPELAKIIGTSPPKLLVMTSSSIITKLTAGTLDVGMCGYLITWNRSVVFDFTPFYMPSGFQAVIRKPTDVPSTGDVFTFIVSSIDGKAQLIFLFLLFIIFVYGHVISLAENVAYSGKQNIRTGYFEATMDGMWLAINQLSTVGCGQAVPGSLSLSHSLSLSLLLSLALSFSLLLSLSLSRSLSLYVCI